jgi:hypothetical protein
LQKIERLNQRNHYFVRRIQVKKTNNHFEVRFMTKLSTKREPLRMLSLCALFFFIGVVTVHATTYYVATTGSDSNPGTSTSPWRNPQKCTAPPIKAGDTCLVGDGTYTDSDGNGLVVYASGSSVQGTAGAPITIKSLNQYGAKIVLSGSNTHNNEGFHLTRNYYIIDGFDISGGTGSSTTVGNHGIVLTEGTGVIIRNNKIHNIGRTVCSTTTFGFTGLFLGGGGVLTSLTIDNNIFASIGRLRVGESGCGASVAGDHNDHGMYLAGNGGSPGINGVTITRNLCYDTNRGYCLQFYGGSVSNAHVWNNTFADGSPTGVPAGQIMLASTLSTSDFKNNIFYNPLKAPFTIYNLTCSAITIDYTLTNNTDSDLFISNLGKPACVTVGTHNHINTNPGFTNAGSRIYTLAQGSAAINAGTNVGVLVPDGVTDIGAYQFGVSALRPPQNMQIQ